MTEPRNPLSDEDLSAVLDGEASDDVVERLAGDTPAQARLAALRDASEAVTRASVPDLTDPVIDGLIGRALAAADDAVDGSTDRDGAHEGLVAPLRSSRRRSGGVPPLLVAAAVILLTGLGLVLVWSGRQTSPTARDVAASVPEATAADADGDSDAWSSAADEAPTQATIAPQSGAAEKAGDADAELVALGDFATPAALRSAIREGFAAGRPTAGLNDAEAPTVDSGTVSAYRAAPAAVERCDRLVQEVFSVDTAAEQSGVARVDGEQVLVYRYRHATKEVPGSTTLVVAARRDSCDVVLSFAR